MNENIKAVLEKITGEDGRDKKEGIYVLGKSYYIWLADLSQDHTVNDYFTPTNFGSRIVRPLSSFISRITASTKDSPGST